MSVLISDCYEISQSNLNNSKAKQLYSFPKSDRFTSNHRLANPKLCYEQSPLFKGKKLVVKFGSEKRVDPFYKREQTPPPDKYQIESQFSPTKFSKKFSHKS